MTSPFPRRGLEITLFGGFAAHLDGRPVDGIFYGKMRALLAYLAVEREQDHRREALAELLWCRNDPATARGNLRRTLSDLRRVLESSSGLTLFAADKHSIRFIPNAAVDATGFIQSAMAAAQHSGTTQQDEERVVALYRGEFLAGLSFPDSPDFEDWLQERREALHRRALALLENLSNRHAQMGDYGKALQFALRYIELEPWDEDAHRRAMLCYAFNGQNSAAIQQYEVCCRLLKSELGVLPGEGIRQLATSIRNGKLPPSGSLALSSIQSDPGSGREAVATPTASVLLSPADRRQVTVLYCELAIAAVDDPDEAMELLRAPQARCAAIIRGLSGHVVQTHGGGLLAYFGYPHAQEDAARRAVLAALAATRETGGGVDIRAAVHTGLVITGGETAMPDMVGKTSRIAIRLRDSAAYASVAISQTTQDIVAGYFECISLGTQSLADSSQPLEVFKVLRKSGARTRLDAAAQLTPLVGRQAEIARLMGLWKKTTQGGRQVVLIQGEAGLGKSRLLHALQERLLDQPHTVYELRCFPEFSQSPFHPLIALLESRYGFQPDDAPEAKHHKLAAFLKTHYPAAAHDAIPLLSQLLSLPFGGHDRTSGLSPQRRKERTLDMLFALLRTRASQQPVLLIVEDLHWIDPSTLELLVKLAGSGEEEALLMICTARPDFVPPWGENRATFLSLAPLAGEEVACMIASLTGDIPAATIDRIVERADGVPLFVEEMVKIASLDDRADIPATLHDLLAARLDHMGEAKYTAQLAATLGREFDGNLLRKISPRDPAALARDLDALQDAGLLLQRNETTLHFKHALIQEAAYQSQPLADRKAAHQRISHVLLADFPDVVENRPEIIARHFNEGGETFQAINYWNKAAQLTPIRCCTQETVAYLRAGLAALEALPVAAAEKDGLEFALQVQLAFAWQEMQGFGEAALRAFHRAIELSERLGDAPGLFQAQLGLCLGITTHPGLPNTKSLTLGRRLLEKAEADGDVQRQQQAHHVVGNTLLWMGQYAKARFHQERAMALDPSAGQEAKADDSGRITGLAAQASWSWALWFLGFPDQAQAASRLSIERARCIGHPITLVNVLTYAAALQRWLGDAEATLRLAGEAVALVREQGLSPLWLLVNCLQQGWALARQGRTEGLAQIRQSINSRQVLMGGAIVGYNAVLADALLQCGQAAEALEVLTETLEGGEKQHDRHWEAELHRLKGECLLALSRCDDAEACFNRALEVSRTLGAKSLELRAATSMARLWRKQGRHEDAQHVLAEVYDGFSEGFDNLDMRKAAELLASLR